MDDWIHIQAQPGEQLTRLHHFTMNKPQTGGGTVTLTIVVKEFAVPPPGQRMRFYAECDKPVNQKSGAFVPAGWGTSLFSALGDCVRLIRQFPYDSDAEAAS